MQWRRKDMTNGIDGAALERPGWREVGAGLLGLLARAFVLAVAVGLLLAAAGLALAETLPPAPASGAPRQTRYSRPGRA
jgi:hypothetical protein